MRLDWPRLHVYRFPSFLAKVCASEQDWTVKIWHWQLGEMERKLSGHTGTKPVAEDEENREIPELI